MHEFHDSEEGLLKFTKREAFTGQNTDGAQQTRVYTTEFTITEEIARTIWEIAQTSSNNILSQGKTERSFRKVVLTPDNSTNTEDRIVLEIKLTGSRDFQKNQEFKIFDTDLRYLKILKNELKREGFECNLKFETNGFMSTMPKQGTKPATEITADYLPVEYGAITGKIDEVAAYDIFHGPDTEYEVEIFGQDKSSRKHKLTLSVNKTKTEVNNTQTSTTETLPRTIQKFNVIIKVKKSEQIA